MRILRQLATKSTNKKVRELMEELNRHLQSLPAEHDFNTEKIVTDLDKGKMIIAQLSDELNR
jgi:two-component sensor histidine kinase